MINLKRVVQALGSTKVAAVPSLHVLSGADIAGSFAEKGNATCRTIFMTDNEENITALANLGTRD